MEKTDYPYCSNRLQNTMLRVGEEHDSSNTFQEAKGSEEEKVVKHLAIEDRTEDTEMDDEDDIINDTAILRPAKAQTLKKNEVMKMMNGFQIPFTVDTGADITAVPEELVPLTGNTVLIRNFHGHLRQKKTARLNLFVGGHQLQRMVAVCSGNRLRGMAILATDISDDADMVADMVADLFQQSVSVSVSVSHNGESSLNENSVDSINFLLPDESADNSSVIMKWN